jgi:hypothetical protein
MTREQFLSGAKFTSRRTKKYKGDELITMVNGHYNEENQDHL